MKYLLDMVICDKDSSLNRITPFVCIYFYYTFDDSFILHETLPSYI